MSPTAQFIAFIIGFLAVLAAFITLIVIVARRLNGRLTQRRHGLVEGVIIAGILLGIVMIFQQITLNLFGPGFLLLLLSTLAFILWSHVTPQPGSRAREGGSEAAER
jgi:hypothetical protein